MKKSILVILIVLLAFTLWSVLAFGKAKRSEDVQPPTEIQKAEPGPAPEDFPAVVLPSKVKPSIEIRGTVEEFQKNMLEKKGWTPEKLEELKGTPTEPVPEAVAKELMPMGCWIRNQPPGGAYYNPGGSDYLMYWEQVRIATLMDLDDNYFACTPPYYPFDVDSIGMTFYSSVECSLRVFAQIYRALPLDEYHCMFLHGGRLLTTDTVWAQHVGGFVTITLPVTLDPACLYDKFFAVFGIVNTDDWGPGGPYEGEALSWIFTATPEECNGYWNSTWLGAAYWYDVVPNGITGGGAVRVQVYGHTQPTNACPYPPANEWYFKDAFADAPCGLPDFDQYQMPGAAFCGPTAGANSLWWFAARGDFPPSWGGLTPADVPALINEIAAASGTDPVLGTECDLLEEGIINTIYAHGGWWFYESTYYAPDFWIIQKELRDCEDVILLLGFWQTTDQGASWTRFGGHFVTLAGVDIYPDTYYFAFSDPAQDLAEFGWPGFVCHDSLTPFPHPGSPLVHNNTANASYDVFEAAWPSESPGGFVWLPYYEVFEGNWPLFQNQNFRPEHQQFLGTYNPAFDVVVEIEQAIVVSPGPKEFDGEVTSSKAYEIESNVGGIKDWGVYHDNAWFYATTYAQCGSFYLGNSDATMRGAAQNFYPVHTFLPLAPPTCDSFFITGAAGDYKIMQCTYQFDHPDLGLRVTKYAFGVWVPEGGTEDCEYAIEDVYVVENISVITVDSIAKGVLIDLDGPGEGGDGGGFDQAIQTVWMYDLVDPSYMFGVTEKPADLIKPATGYCIDNQARVWDYDLDSIYYWMRDLGWGSDGVTDLGYLLADPLFSLQPGQIIINKYLKWGYHDTDSVYDGQLDQGSRHFLYNVLHQEGFYRGDVNKDGKLDVSDVIYQINFLFKGGPMPIEFKNQGDVNCDGNTDISDVIYVINYLFKGGAAPIDKNRFFLESPFVDPDHKAAYEPRVPGLFGDPDWKYLGQ